MPPRPDLGRVQDAVDRAQRGRVLGADDVQTLVELAEHVLAQDERDERRADLGIPADAQVARAAVALFLGVSTDDDMQLLVEAVDHVVAMLARHDLAAIRAEQRRRRRAAAASTTGATNDH